MEPGFVILWRCWIGYLATQHRRVSYYLSSRAVHWVCRFLHVSPKKELICKFGQHLYQSGKQIFAAVVIEVGSSRYALTLAGLRLARELLKLEPDI